MISKEEIKRVTSMANSDQYCRNTKITIYDNNLLSRFLLWKDKKNIGKTMLGCFCCYKNEIEIYAFNHRRYNVGKFDIIETIFHELKHAYQINSVSDCVLMNNTGGLNIDEGIEADALKYGLEMAIRYKMKYGLNEK